jgi:hypothetical protein
MRHRHGRVRTAVPSGAAGNQATTGGFPALSQGSTPLPASASRPIAVRAWPLAAYAGDRKVEQLVSAAERPRNGDFPAGRERRHLARRGARRDRRAPPACVLTQVKVRTDLRGYMHASRGGS